MNTLKRGLTLQEAMEYVGVKRRTFDEVWRPQLVGMRAVELDADRRDFADAPAAAKLARAYRGEERGGRVRAAPVGAFQEGRARVE